MSGLLDLSALLSSMAPRLRDGEFVFVTIPGEVYGTRGELHPVAAFAEDEGLSLVVQRDRAEEEGLAFDGLFRMITLDVHSSLEAVGLTAAVASALTTRGISANVVAAFHHDHVFVPAARADEALQALEALSSEASR